MPDTIRVAVIGVGQQGERHVARYTQIPEAELVAVADLDEARARAIAQRYGVPHVYTDYHDLLARDDIDAVDVVLHNRLHMPVTVEALEAGKNVYVEKPMSWCYRDAKVMYDKAKELGRMLHVQLAQLYVPGTRAAKKLIDEGYLGELYYAKSTHYRRRGRPFVDGYGTASFVNTRTAGGGAMLDVAVYHLSRMIYLLGNPELLSVSGATFQKVDNMYEDRRLSSGYNVEEFGMGFIRLAGGIVYYMEEAWAIHSDNPDHDYLYGSKGGVRIDPVVQEGGQIRSAPIRYFTTLADIEMDGTMELRQTDWRWQQVDPKAAHYTESQRHWISAQLGLVPLLDTAGIALKTAEITEGIYLSQHLGREVTAQEIAQAEPESYRLQS
ncbi:MAG: Gfo/Idh/MocA family oxidoreductase [Chloroflexi bacterium]|nr:Gfo/Idh/MocA family oxidoreductase [Chloroflexota bacterium]